MLVGIEHMYVVVLGVKFSPNNHSAIEQISDRETEFEVMEEMVCLSRYVVKVVKVEAKGTDCEKDERTYLWDRKRMETKTGTLLGKGEPLEK